MEKIKRFIKKYIKFLFVFCLAGAGIFCFWNSCRGQVQTFFDDKGNLISKILSTGEPAYQRFENAPLSIEKIGAEGEEPKSQGYIVQFQEKPLINKWQEFQEAEKVKKKRGLFALPTINSQFQLYQSSFNSKFLSNKSSLSGAVSNFDQKIQKEFKNVFNGIALDISAKEAEEIKKLNFVKNVYPNYEVKALLTDSVPLINADDVWGLGYNGTGITIAILDTGIDYTHPDLGGCFGPECKVIGGYDFVNLDSDPMDDHGHGTHCAGIAAANGTLKGVAEDALLLAYKVLDSGGSGWDADIIAAVERAVDPNQDEDYSDHANVISLSLGGWGNPDDSLSQAVDNAVDAGVVVVVAAGNDGEYGYETIGSPGTARKAITVGASDKSDEIAYFSSRGPVIWDNKSLIKPDIVAPGVSITAPVPFDIYPAGYVTWSGTSMATPHVAGVAALIIEAHPDWTPQEIKMALRNTAVDIGENVLIQGYGRVDALAAVQLIDAPPIAELAETTYEASGLIDISGTATGTNFVGYNLYYGAGYNPDSWNLICNAIEPVTEGILCSDFDTSLANDGEYLLKLAVNGTDGQSSEDRNLIVINNIELTYPLNNDIHRAGTIMPIEGTAQGTGFQNYLIHYGLGENPLQWLSIGITLAGGGTLQIWDGTLAYWDTSSITEAGFYAIRLTVNFVGGESQELIRNVYLDPTLKEGWPKRINWYYDEVRELYYWGGYLEPVVSDINNDGQKEIVVYLGGNPTKLYVFKEDSTILNGWPVEIDEVDLAGGNLAAPSVVDIDKDGYKEILVNGNQKIYIYNYNGSLRAEISVPGYVSNKHAEIVISDLDNDGNFEIIFQWEQCCSFEKNGDLIAVFDSQGNMLNGWPQLYYDEEYGEETFWSCTAAIESTLAVGNFDVDSDKEVVVGGCRNVFDDPLDPPFYGWHCEGRVHVYNLDGSMVPGFPVDIDGKIFSSPAIGDINNDGDDEIVVATMQSSNSGIYVIDRSGQVINGWPQLIGEDIWTSPALADFNNDGYLEITTSTIGWPFDTYIFDYQGNILSGWPQQTSWNNYRSLITGDANNNGGIDILTTAGGGNGFYGDGGVYAWNFDGTQIEGFPKITEMDAQAAATITDIDNDGKLELVASSDYDYDRENGQYKNRGTIYVWELDKDYNRGTMKWPMFHHDPQHTGLYGACGLSTSLASINEDTTLPYYANQPAPDVVISGEQNMLCRWGNEDIIYSQMSNEVPYQCSVEGSIATCYLDNQGEDGEKTVYISCKDDFGNEQSPYQNLNVTFILDTQKPIVFSTTVSPDPAKAGEVTITIVFSDEGVGMNTTINPNVTITGLAISYTATPTEFLETAEQQTSAWRGKFTLLDEEEEKKATISVTGAKDLAGNVMNDNLAAGTFQVDSIAPNKPTVTDPASAITINADTYIIQGAAEVNALVTVYGTLGPIWTQQLNDGATSYSIIVSLEQDFANLFTVTATDTAGNESEAATVSTITEDSVPPTTLVHCVRNDETGRYDSTPPYYTNATTPVIIATPDEDMSCRWGESDAIYSEMLVENECTENSEAPSNRDCHLTDQGEDGEKTVYISCKDMVGNEQTSTQNLDVVFTLDTTTSKPTHISYLTGDANQDGIINATESSNITLDIAAEVDSELEMFVDEELIGLPFARLATGGTALFANQDFIDAGITGLAPEAPDYSVPKVITFKAIDKAGNYSDPSDGLSITKDTVGSSLENIIWDDLDASNSITKGDKLKYTFSEAIDVSTIIVDNLNADLPPSNTHIYGDANLAIEWDNNVLTITLGDNADLEKGTDTINPADTVLDLVGNSDNSTDVILPDIDTIAPPAPTINPAVTPTYNLIQLITGTKQAYTSVWLNDSKIIDLDNETTWSHEVSLSVGENEINIKVKDLALNESESATTSITRRVAGGGGGGGGGGGATPIPPPQISDISADITFSTATISWKTNKPAASTINYGLTAAYGKTVSSKELVTSHSLTLIGLASSTAYHYQIQSTDSTGSAGTYADKTFTTLAGLAEEAIEAATIVPSGTGQVTAISAEGGAASVKNLIEAVKINTEVAITPISKAAAAAGSPPSGSSIAGGYVYNFSATSAGEAVTTFFQPITLVFTYTDEQITGLDESSLAINYWSEGAGKWVNLETTVNLADNTLTAITNHFTYFAIVGKLVVAEKVIKEKTASEMTIAELKAKIVQITALIVQLQAQLQQLLGQQAVAGIPAGYQFAESLSLGDRNIEVKYLQIFLKNQGADIYPQGLVTGYFGYLTLNAVKKFQLKYGIITPQTTWKIAGYVGPETRTKINEILATQ